MENHRILFEGIEFEVNGEYEKPEEETNSKGGWLSYQVFVNGSDDILWALNDYTIGRINEIVLDENY